MRLEPNASSAAQADVTAHATTSRAPCERPCQLVSSSSVRIRKLVAASP
jgi:hypothetical protein